MLRVEPTNYGFNYSTRVDSTGVGGNQKAITLLPLKYSLDNPPPSKTQFYARFPFSLLLPLFALSYNIYKLIPGKANYFG